MTWTSCSSPPVSPKKASARRILQIARLCFRVDVDLRPEGRAGPLTRSLDSYGAYWERWAATWEFQALLKARAVAGDEELGHRFETAAIDHVWGQELQRRRARRGAVHEGPDRGDGGRPGTARTRDQAGSGRDPGHRVRRAAPPARPRWTRPRDQGPLDTGRAGGAGRRRVRHRRGCRRPGRVLPLPADRRAPIAAGGGGPDPLDSHRPARHGGVWPWCSAIETTPRHPATSRFDDALRQCQRDVRAIHERLFFRPLLEAFATVDTLAQTTDSRDTGDGAAETRGVRPRTDVAPRP